MYVRQKSARQVTHPTTSFERMYCRRQSIHSFILASTNCNSSVVVILPPYIYSILFEMQDEVLDRCRKAASSEEQTKALEAVVDYVRQEGVRISAKEWVARSVILEFPYSQNVDSIDRILDGCGTVTSLSIVAKILREFSSKGSSSTMTQLPFQSVLQASFKTIHRLLLSSKGLQTEDLKQDVQQFVKMILLFPQIIANACHKLQLHQPAWATPSKFFTQLVASAEAGENDHHYTSTLIKAMLRSLKSDFVAMGLANRHPFTKAAKLDLSPRETAMFVFSMLQHFVSSDPENDNVLETCLQILKASSPEHREAFVQFSVLSKHDSRICNWIVQLLESCDCLYSNLCDIAETWSQWSFVHQTEGQHQYAVTQVLLCGLSKLKTEETPGGDDLTLALLQGVTHRLESSFPPIRKDGMQIAQAVAKRLGEDLQFEELNQQLGNATQENANPGESLERNRSVMIENPKKEETIKRRRKPRVKRRQLDPDADYESSDDDEQDDGTTEDDGSDSFDDNSITWDDELAPYDLNDPEDDLVETRKPLHLIECLELLRTIESDDHAYSSHETALQSLPDLIQSRPDNLPDIAVSLVLQLLRMENKFNITNFLEMRQDAMTCLVIQEPILVGQHLIDEVFEDGALGDRLNIFAALQEAAYDLSESKSLDEHRAKRDQQ
jgi:hypothetical protein